MKYIEYVQLSPFERFVHNFKEFFVSIPKNIVKFFKFLALKIAAIVIGIGKGVKNYVLNFIRGDWSTKTSYLVMGSGCVAKGQYIKGFIYFVAEVLYICFIAFFGLQYITKFGSLGTVETQRMPDPDTGLETTVTGDDSMKILLFSTLVIIVSIIFLVVYLLNIKSSLHLEEVKKQGKKPKTFVEDVKTLLDERFQITLLSVPMLLVGCFTVLPLVFMVFIAFTNWDQAHQVPDNLVQWVGFKNFTEVFYSNPKYAYTFGQVLQWTFIWAILATFSNYILGMIVALMINKKGIKFKSFYRTAFVMVIAVPQFVTLLLMNQMFTQDGVVNQILQNFHLVAAPIKFWDDAMWTKSLIVLINIWIGIPYTILVTSGILMNIPEDLYESARIDGASPFKTFTKITLPYMLFVTAPNLITTFVNNINNFNVIFLLNGGGPMENDYYNAGQSDLLVSWLYRLAFGKNDYRFAATIGIVIFVISATFSLIAFNMTKSAKNEEEFS